jgi:hypothetical protein
VRSRSRSAKPVAGMYQSIFVRMLLSSDPGLTGNRANTVGVLVGITYKTYKSVTDWYFLLRISYIATVY